MHARGAMQSQAGPQETQIQGLIVALWFTHASLLHTKIAHAHADAMSLACD